MRVKGAVSQEILRKLMITGAIVIAGQSPHFWLQVYRRLWQGKTPFGEDRVAKDAFYYLKKRGLITGEVRDNQLYIHLTPEGEKEAGRYQINRLKIKSQKQWDKKWRLLIFDIPEVRRVKREALRGKLKELGFFPLQKSVWVIPFPCEKEIKLLRDFFNLKPKEIRVFETAKLEEDQFLKDIFKL